MVLAIAARPSCPVACRISAVASKPVAVAIRALGSQSDTAGCGIWLDRSLCADEEPSGSSSPSFFSVTGEPRRIPVDRALNPMNEDEPGA